MDNQNNTYQITTTPNGYWATCTFCSGLGCTYIPAHDCTCEFCWKKDNLFKKEVCTACSGTGNVWVSYYLYAPIYWTTNSTI